MITTEMTLDMIKNRKLGICVKYGKNHLTGGRIRRKEHELRQPGRRVGPLRSTTLKRKIRIVAQSQVSCDWLKD